MKRDEEGFVIVTVADLIKYLGKYPDNMEVHLDKDGWMCGEINPLSVEGLIEKRGLFSLFRNTLFINN